ADALIEAHGVRLPARHIAASGGLLGGLAPALESVRAGLGLYGIAPDDLTIPPVRSTTDSRAAPALRPVMSLHARPVRVVDLRTGTGISYGPTFTTARPSRIATLPLGYGDGWVRAYGNRTHALVRGVRAPLV